MLSTLLLCYITSVLYVALRSTQQLNVMNGRYSLIAPTSLGMAVADYYIIQNVVNNSEWVILAFGLGGATGCILGMRFDKYLKWRKACEKAEDSGRA